MSFARVRALVFLGVLVLLALVFGGIALLRDTQTGSHTAAGCPEGYQLVDVRLREAKDVKINVYNATTTGGLAGTVAGDFRNRKFQVLKTETAKKGVDAVAILRYGPKAVGSVHLLRAYFLNEAEREYNPDREDDVVDVVIGTGFKQLATITEVNQSLAALGQPELPNKRTCADTGKS